MTDPAAKGELAGGRSQGRVTPTPRPRYDGPAAIRAAEVPIHLWGDDEAGEVADWIYLSNDSIHHLVFGLPPGGAFRHSEAFRTIFAADELLYVLSGQLVIANPALGEVHRLAKGEAVFFRRDTWHHAFSVGPEALRVVEFFAPPPAAGASSAYAQTKEMLTESRYLDERFIGTWPMSREKRASEATMLVFRDEGDLLWEVPNGKAGALVGLYVSTENLTSGRVELRPGARTGPRSHQGDMSFHILAGPAHLLLLDWLEAAGRWHQLESGDGFFLPGGTRYELFNMGSGDVSALFGGAAGYLPER